MQDINDKITQLRELHLDTKWSLLQLSLTVSLALNTILILSSFSISEKWGSGAKFHLISTALISLLANLYFFFLARQRSLQNRFNIDFLGGIFICLTFNLFQASLLWSGFASGLGFTKVERFADQVVDNGQRFPSGDTENLCSNILFLLFLINTFLTAIVHLWKEELNSNGQKFVPVGMEKNIGNINFDKYGVDTDEEEDDFGSYQKPEGDKNSLL
eukprot:maker-scaffold_12-snap-gene-3.18-mRNA-1 protein AED:0.00 eAED:0.00 QI:130/1/1/1/1/1/2/31/215